MIDIEEFKKAIEGSRLMELNLSTVLDKLGVNYKTSEQRYKAFQNSQKRRRLLKKKWDENVRKVTREVIEKLSAISDTPLAARDGADEKMYST